MIFQLFSCKPLVISPLRPFQFHSSPIISYFTLLTTSNIFLLHHTCFAAAQATQKIDQEENNYLDDLLATLQTYQMKFDAHCPIGRFPRCFAQEFSDRIDSHIILRDPSHNEFEVHVAKRSRELYFDDGWSALRDVYDLWFGVEVRFSIMDHVHNYEFYVSFYAPMYDHTFLD
ncbi:hypothetical protein QL285_058196 [Trifolium repens]|nr:hypothetical protein QL285_058196 [Trifolium repens]